jgi:hypothetical protein
VVTLFLLERAVVPEGLLQVCPEVRHLNSLDEGLCPLSAAFYQESALPNPLAKGKSPQRA